jgi:hypothetical protein
MMRAIGVTRRSQGLAAAAAIVLGAALAGPSQVAAAAGPFDGLEGIWTGDGMITYASGTQERLSCRVQYLQSNPNNLQQALRCASDSYNFQINAYFDSANGKLSGNWAELVNNVSGSVSGTAAVGRINGDLKGPGFNATLNVVTKGDRQTVNIQAPINEIRAVSIEVRKSK